MTFKLYMYFRSVIYAISNNANISVPGDCRDFGCLSTWKLLEGQLFFAVHIEYYRQYSLVIDI